MRRIHEVSSHGVSSRGVSSHGASSRGAWSRPDSRGASSRADSWASGFAVRNLATSLAVGTAKLRGALIEDDPGTFVDEGGLRDHVDDHSQHCAQNFDHPAELDLNWYEQGGFREGSRCAKALAFMDRFVIPESNTFRKIWELLLLIMLLYIGIVFPFRLAFVQFKLTVPADMERGCDFHVEGEIWETIEVVITVYFWIDLFLNFLLTYRRIDDTEECNFTAILLNYMSGFFWINLLACLPTAMFEPLVDLLDIDPGGCSAHTSGASAAEGSIQSNQVARLLRLRRITRLARMARVLRIFKIANFLQKSATKYMLQVLRSFRMLNWICCLCWVVHLLACGWYLCAALHVDHAETWVGRRVINNDWDTLLTQGSWVQWAHAMYFILTVFTTVGFGDMSALTVGEIVYVCIVMLVGAVVHSIIISEMINLLGEVDEDTKWKRTQRKLLAAYGQHAMLRGSTLDKLNGWVSSCRLERSTYDRDEMRRLLTSGIVPRKILGEMPEELFGGVLAKSRFMRTCAAGCQGGIPPPRFSLLLSTMLSPQSFQADEVVYQMHDHAFNMFFVMSGTFANVGEVAADGGRDSILYGNGLGLTPDKRVRAAFSVSAHPFGASSVNGHVKQAANHYAKDLSIATDVVNPPESDRTYSSSIDGTRSNPNSLLGQKKSAWSADARDGQWLQMDLGQAKPVGGIVVQGHPWRDEWVTKFAVSTFDDREDWREVAVSHKGCTDKHTMVEIFFPEPCVCKLIRIEPLEWHGSSISMRAGVSVVQNTLFPYQVFGRYDYFGEDVSQEGTRSATVRCEDAGQVLLLHKQDLVQSHGGSGLRLLSEFPQFSRLLKVEFLRREALRKRMLKKLTRAQPYPAFRHFAASAIQSSYRRYREGNPLVSWGPTTLPKSGAGQGARSFDLVVDRGAERADAHRRSASARMWLDGPSQGRAPEDQLEARVNGLSANVEHLRAELGGKLSAVQASLEALTAAMQGSVPSAHERASQ